MPNRFTFLLTVSALALTAGAALAQSAPAATPSTTVAPLTVRAAPEPKVIQKQARTFVQSYAAAPNPEIDQIGRWHDPVCVKVLGQLQADQAAMIKARIESVAQAVGLRAPWTTPDGCRADVEIVFTDQPQHVMDIIAQRREYMLGYYHFHDRDRLKTVTRPIQAWYVTATDANDPMGAATAVAMSGHVVETLSAMNPTGRGVIDDPEQESPYGCGDSPHFTACYRSLFSNVFMVADSKALEGKDAGLIADYLVMLALSQPKSLDGCNALPSVIDVLAKSACPGRDAPDGLTPSDAAYLTALYASDPEAMKNFEQSDIARRMADILIKANTVGAGLKSAPPADAKAR